MVRFSDGAGNERSLRYRTYAQLREGDGITPGPEWNGPLVLVTEVMEGAYIAGAITVRADSSSGERAAVAEAAYSSDRLRCRW